MQYYPAFLDLTGKKCLVVGAGGVGLRKIATLLECSPLEILVLDTAPVSDELKSLMNRGNVVYENRSFEESDIVGRILVFAATGNREANNQISQTCDRAGVLCNCIDAPEEGSFIVPAHVKDGPLTLAVSTSGGSPALSRRMKKDLLDHFGPRYAPMAVLLKRLRPHVLRLGQPTESNTALFRKLVNSQLPELLAEARSTGSNTKAESLLKSLLPAPLEHITREILDDVE